VIYRFETGEIDSEAFEFRVDGKRVPVEPQVFEVLLFLVQNRHRLCARTEILDTVWGDRFVSDSALASRIASARSLTGDDGRTQRIIRTVHGRGVQFVAEVEEISSAPLTSLVDSEPADQLHQVIRFCTAPDGAQLAMASVGDGPPLVKAANWLTHVERDWQSPVWRHWLEAFGRRFRYIRYDLRGCGLSDRDLSGVSLSNLDTWTSDLEAVVEASDLDTFALLGVSQGAAPAMDYAVKYPERVTHLILYGGYAKGMHLRGPEAVGQAGLLADLIRVGWGGENPAFRSVFTTNFMPEASSEQMRWFNDLQRVTTSPENALLIETAFNDNDFRELARKVSVPTLVLHSRGDMATPYGEGRELAQLIPGAEFTTLESANHILVADEPGWVECLRRIDQFLQT
jgi:pimeloyl-ACP methyl ester carboxylesterase/DNA-binding winged helix-turn-helix (wHTH) protein